MATGLQKLQAHIHALGVKREKIRRALVAERAELYPDETTIEALERNFGIIDQQIEQYQARVDKALNGSST